MSLKKSNRVLVLLWSLLGVGIIPFSVSLLLNFPLLFSSYRSFSKELLFFGGGFAAFIGIFFTFGPPVKSYILEHELSHILFALLSGVRIKKISLRKGSGSITTERVNIFIALAPYSVPLYTILLVFLFRIFTIFYSSSLLSYLFFSFIGITLSFHIVATIHYIQIDQPDLKRYGYFPSLVIIITWSVVVLSLIFSFIFEKVELLSFYRMSVLQAMNIYKKLFLFFFSLRG